MIPTYEARAAAYSVQRGAAARHSAVISRLRLATFLPGAACLLYAGARTFSMPALVAGIVLMFAFGLLVVWHARVEQRVAWWDALHTVVQFNIARLQRAWDRLPLPPEPGPALAHHAYAHDLDLFGRASLLQWVGPAATASGAATLQRWLLEPAAPPIVAARQQALTVLSPAVEWREQLAAHGRLTAGVRLAELEAFLSWAEGPGPFSSGTLRWLRAAVLALTGAIWILILLQAAGAIEAMLWLIPLLLGVVLSFVTAAHVHGEFNRANAGEHAFARYGDLVALATGAPLDAPLLRELHATLTADAVPAPVAMRRLMSILGYAQLRSGAAILHFPIQALTLWDFHVFFALDRWRRTAGGRIRAWMGALGELDALSAFAQIAHDNPAWCLPDVFDTRAGRPLELHASAIGHPLIAGDRRVTNDVTVGPPGTLLLITGSNMSGKSTLLRAIGLNAVLAQAGAPVCAGSLRMPSLDVETSIRVQDSLEQGLSYFMAALARLKGVLDRAREAREGQIVLYLLDEILQGTNTVERSVAVRGVARHLLRAGAIGVMTTHDLALAGEEPLRTAARLGHFSETVDPDGRMTFEYRLRPGLATSRNALRLMQMIGMDLDEGPEDSQGP